MAMDHGYGGGEFEEGNPNDTRMNRVQVLMQRTFAGWPLYTMIISFGQLLSAVSVSSVNTPAFAASACPPSGPLQTPI